MYLKLMHKHKEKSIVNMFQRIQDGLHKILEGNL